ncbi:MAG TPA: AraC family transcriptional regulator [Puia sp.]|nr:AraC family transcriptional regulator [Puia sp.]
MQSIVRAATISSCYIGPTISPEQFIAEHFFLYLAQGSIVGYDGHKKYTMKAGEYCIARKNHLARYSKLKDNGGFSKVVVVFDEIFLKAYQKKHKVVVGRSTLKDAFVLLNKNELVPNFVYSLASYYKGEGKIDETFSQIKREELLLILLQTDPELATIFFDFGIPEKIDLEAFMNNNYKFNVSIEHFAYLTGRSLSAFKRDFKKIFDDTPNHWLIDRRLREGYFMIDEKGKKPSDIYLELGFENLSHFSFVFKKMFGITPASLLKK